MTVSQHQAELEATSPFAGANLSVSTGGIPEAPAGEALLTPFSDSVSAYDENLLAEETADALAAEFADEEFEEAVQSLVDEAAARHLRAAATWTHESEAPELASAEAEQWVNSVVAETDRVLGELETYFGDRQIDSLREGELAAAAGIGGQNGLGLSSPLDAQERWFGSSLLKKVGKVVKAVGKLAKKGIKTVASLGLGKLFGLLRPKITSFLRWMLGKAIGRLPARLRPLARTVARRFTGEAEAPGEYEGDEYGDEESPTEEFDRQLAELVLAPTQAAADQLLAEAEPAADGHDARSLHDLDAARVRLARELADATEGESPVAAMEGFLPAIMAVRPLVRAGIGIVGRQRVVNFIAATIARLISGIAGRDRARLLSRYIADTGLKLLGLEAESGADPVLGTEALVAAAEDTARQVLSLPPESLEDERVLEAEVQEAFAEAAARHMPASVLKPDLVEGEPEAEHGFWVQMPRETSPLYRYKKYCRIVPVRITRTIARSMAMPDGDTLEQRLLDAGVTSWPVHGEMEMYELLDGAELGHVAAFETEATHDGLGDATSEFEQLTQAAATLLARNPRLVAAGRHGWPVRGRRGGMRYYRLRVGGRALRRHGRLALRLDLMSPQPVLAVHLWIGERDSHALAAHLERRNMTQVVSLLRGLAGPAMRQTMAQRLERMLSGHKIAARPGAARRLAGELADAMVRAMSRQLPEAAPMLAQAARDPAPGVTLTFCFTFPGRASIATATPARPTLTIRPGHHHD